MPKVRYFTLFYGGHATISHPRAGGSMLRIYTHTGRCHYKRLCKSDRGALCALRRQTDSYEEREKAE